MIESYFIYYLIKYTNFYILDIHNFVHLECNRVLQRVAIDRVIFGQTEEEIAPFQTDSGSIPRIRSEADRPVDAVRTIKLSEIRLKVVRMKILFIF